MKRIPPLLAKELTELRRSPSIFLPALLTGAAAILYPFVIAIIVPYFAGERLSNSGDFELATQMFRSQPEARSALSGPLRRRRIANRSRTGSRGRSVSFSDRTSATGLDSS